MAGEGMISILMPCCGQLEFTRLSLPRVLRHSRTPYEVWLIEAGALDGTADYLDGVADTFPQRVRVLHGEESQFATLVNEAISSAQGEQVAWVSNDVLVPELWLNQLSALLQAHEKMALVGPTSNLAAEGQRVLEIPYRLGRPRQSQNTAGLATEAVDQFAREVREVNKGQWQQVDSLGGFCWLARREILRQIAPFGSPDGFDERAFSASIRKAGGMLSLCRDLYVHHFGSNLRGG